MTALVDFLLARIAEDEAVARAVLNEHEMYDWDAYMSGAGWYHSSARVFAQRNDPARVLAECKAKRQIVASFADAARRHQCDVDELFFGETLHALALPHADHPDYREEWRP